MQAWQVQSNIEAFGYYEAAKMLRKRKLPFALAYALMFGRPARIL